MISCCIQSSIQQRKSFCKTGCRKNNNQCPKHFFIPFFRAYFFSDKVSDTKIWYSYTKLQPTCIVGTKTSNTPLRSSEIQLQPTCIVGTKTFLFHSDSFAPIDYNPRTSRVLKPLSIHSATPTQTTAHVHRGY